MDFYKGKIPILRRSLDEGFLSNRGDSDIRGAVERDFDVDPVEMGDSPAGMQLIPESEWDARWEEQEDSQSSLEHMFLRDGGPAFDLLDQNGHGYCWAYSTGHAIMLDRMKQNLPLVRINPHATAAIIKGGRDEGGWCGLSMKFGREHGYAVEGTGPGEWPLHSRSLKNDTPELRASMKLHKAEEDWYDLGKREYDQVLAKSQLVTCSFMNNSSPADWMEHSHSMNIVRVVRVEKGRWLPLILNSWKGFGFHGLAVLPTWPNNAVSLRASTPSVK